MLKKQIGGVMVNMPTPHSNDLGSISCPGMCWCGYGCVAHYSSTTSTERDVKQCRSLERTWLKKRKSRGLETGRYPAYMCLMQTEFKSSAHVAR